MHAYIERLSFMQSLAVANSEGKYSPDLYQLWAEVKRRDDSSAPEENLGHKVIKILSNNQLTFDDKIFTFKVEEVIITQPRYDFDDYSRSLVTAPPVYGAHHSEVILYIFN